VVRGAQQALTFPLLAAALAISSGCGDGSEGAVKASCPVPIGTSVTYAVDRYNG
jgi:hypothetical protein